MSRITQEWIVSQMIEFPKNEFEAGRNSAFTRILKALIEPERTKEETKIFYAFGETLFNRLTQDELNSLISFYQENSKLGFVKQCKEIFGIGLYEAKIMADKVWM